MNKDQVLSLVRTLLKVASGIAIAKGYGDSSAWEGGIGLVVALITQYFSHDSHAGDTTPPAPPSKLPLALLLGALICSQGCATFDTNAYKTLAITATTVDSSRQAWNDYVGQGKATVAEVQAVADSYAKYQHAMAYAQSATIAYETTKNQSQLQGAIDAAVAAATNFTSLIAAFRK